MSARTIAKLELRLLLREGVLPGALLLSIGLIVLATLGGWTWNEFRTEAADQVQESRDSRRNTYVADARRYVEGTLNPDWHPPVDPYYVYAFFPHVAVNRPDPLGGLTVGKSDLLPYYRVFAGVPQNDLYHSSEIQNPMVLAAGRFDLAFLVTVLLPLLIIAVSYNLLPRVPGAGDRAHGRSRRARRGRCGCRGCSTLSGTARCGR
jgi:ABC-2 type transport system permease protein